MKILVCEGAGYTGSYMAKMLAGQRHESEIQVISYGFKTARTAAPQQVSGSDYPTHSGSCIRDIYDNPTVPAGEQKKP